MSLFNKIYDIMHTEQIFPTVFLVMSSKKCCYPAFFKVSPKFITGEKLLKSVIYSYSTMLAFRNEND